MVDETTLPMGLDFLRTLHDQGAERAVDSNTNPFVVLLATDDSQNGDGQMANRIEGGDTRQGEGRIAIEKVHTRGSPHNS